MNITREERELLRAIHEEIAEQDKNREPLHPSACSTKADLRHMIRHIAKLIRTARGEFNPIFKAVRPEDAKEMLKRWGENV